MTDTHTDTTPPIAEVKPLDPAVARAMLKAEKDQRLKAFTEDLQAIVGKHRGRLTAQVIITGAHVQGQILVDVED